MNDDVQTTGGSWWRTRLLPRVAELRQREGQVFLILALVIGALTGLVVVAFIMLTERLGMRLYPVGSAPWRRLLFPVVGSLDSRDEHPACQPIACRPCTVLICTKAKRS